MGADPEQEGQTGEDVYMGANLEQEGQTGKDVYMGTNLEQEGQTGMDMHMDTGLGEVRLIAADMDRTLLTDSGELPPGFHEKVLALKEKGIEFAIASGRSLYTLRDIFGDFSRNLIIISDNGAIIWKDGEVILKEVMDESACRGMVRFTEQFPGIVPVVCGLDHAFIPAKYSRYSEGIGYFFTRYTLAEDMSSINYETAKYSIYFPENNSGEYYRKYFEPEYGKDFFVTVGGPDWADIMNPGINKGSGVLKLADVLGLTPDNAMAFGDTDNDKEMLSVVRHGYCMANASMYMRQYARFVAPPNYEYGVLQVVDRVLAAQ